jgi:hypothetical protein
MAIGRGLLACLSAASLLLPAGCGGSRFAEVSGVVTTEEGEPLPDLCVSFQPIGTADKPSPGPGSAGATDKDGRFRLIVNLEQSGAVVGRHRVVITPALGKKKVKAGPDAEERDDPTLAAVVPSRYNVNTELEFVVPPGGTDQANFKLKGVRYPGRKPK